MPKNPIYISSLGGTINCFRGDSGWLFRVCFEQLYLYSNDIISAKFQLNRLEKLKKNSCMISIKSINNERKAFKELVESSAAPYIKKQQQYT